MPLLNISTDEPAGHDLSDMRVAAALATDPGPVTIMVHGYKYQPGHKVHCPHHSLFAVAPRLTGPRIVSWPRHLGLRGQAGEGLGIGFGWPARGGLGKVFARAQDAGARLAVLLDRIAALSPGRPVRLIGHSLGARVCLAGIAGSAPGTVTQAILLAPAEFGSTVRAALDSPGGGGVGVLHVTSRENDVFDALMEALVPPPRKGDRMLGVTCPRLAGMVTLQLDHAPSLAALRAAGFPVAEPARRICHWSAYTRPGVFPIYRAFLDGRLSPERLRAVLPAETAPRWARLVTALRVIPCIHARGLTTG